VREKQYLTGLPMIFRGPRMNRIKIFKYVCFQLLFVSSIISSRTVIAEEMLIKGEAKYIGWQTSKFIFTTCHQDDIEIGDGKIERTSEKCQKAPGGPGPLVMVGTVEAVDPKDETFRIKDEKGRSYDFFFRETGGAKVQLKDIKTGYKLAVISPIKGRAEVIKIEFEVKPDFKTDSTVTPRGVQPKVMPEATPKAPIPQSN
jgi:hypothetical protein